jgi:hypothetical protein
MRYTSQDLDSNNLSDLKKWIDSDVLHGLIDEKKGGIIGYFHHVNIEEVKATLERGKKKRRVYILPKGLYNRDKNYSEISDEDFKLLAKLEGYIISLKKFQKISNKGLVDHKKEVFRFI